MRVVMCCAVMWVYAAVASAQVNPCQAPPTTTPTVLANPAAAMSFYIESPELAIANYVTSVQLGTFLRGVDAATGAPIQSITVQRAALTAVTGAPNCYLGTYGVLPSSLPRGVEHYLAARLTNASGTSVWTRDPGTFIAAGVPLAPANLRVGQ
jgi:hypothetical protein